MNFKTEKGMKIIKILVNQRNINLEVEGVRLVILRLVVFFIGDFLLTLKTRTDACNRRLVKLVFFF